MQTFTEKAITIIRNVPPGKVMTYGQIAKLAGSARGARQVARLLHSMSAKYDLPWHRIVNAQGEIVLADEEGRYTQRALLEAEGVKIGLNGQINLEIYRYNPGDLRS